MDKMFLEFNNVNLDFIQYSNKGSSLKESFIKFIFNMGQKSYTSKTFNVLQNLNFRFEEGDRIALIGKNGAGKSTLLRLICGIYSPKSGTIKKKGKISCLIEIGAGFNPELTGRENIYLSGLIHGSSKKEITSKEEDIIKFADIGDFIDSQVKYYSNGMTLRLAFSIATMIEPEIMVMDELFAGGDVNFIEKATEKLQEMMNKAGIIILSPHDMDYVSKFANKVMYLKDNSVNYFGSDVQYAVNQYLEDNS